MCGGEDVTVGRRSMDASLLCCVASYAVVALTNHIFYICHVSATFFCMLPQPSAFVQVGKMADAMRVALRINDVTLIESTLAGCSDPLEQQQLGYMLARQVRSVRHYECVRTVYRPGS